MHPDIRVHYDYNGSTWCYSVDDGRRENLFRTEMEARRFAETLQREIRAYWQDDTEWDSSPYWTKPMEIESDDFIEELPIEEKQHVKKGRRVIFLLGEEAV